ISREDFNNDAVDAGEIGAGHAVTALYEITPAGSPAERISDLRYGETETVSDASEELAFLKLRYKLPGEDRSRLIETPVTAETREIPAEETRFAAAVAGFGSLLRNDRQITGWDYDDARALAAGARGDDPYGYRSELLSLIRMADALD
ncbi:MAG: YfbK domain-containing protein, partial [Myxococcota bacterium]